MIAKGDFLVVILWRFDLTVALKKDRIATAIYLESGIKFMRTIYLLKDLAHRSGYSPHTLKFYLRRGLLAEMGRSPETNFRYFDDLTLDRLKIIQELRF